MLEKSKERLEKLVLKNNGKKPVLQVILVGDDSASQVYVKMKKKACEKAGITANIHHLNANSTQEQVQQLVEELNKDVNTTGVMVQLPLPKHLNTEKILEKIIVEKDVDGLNPINLARIFSKNQLFTPATAKAVMKLIEETKTDLSGKNAVVLGRSVEVGIPCSALLLAKNCTLSVCHSKTKNLCEITKNADVLVVAIGKPSIVKGSDVKQGAIVIDVGINKVGEKIVGDVEFGSVEKKAGFITPVPGGVGPMTIACLVENVVEAFEKNVELND